MLFVRLSHLMANRRLKIADVCKDTDISRPTLTALYYGTGKGINFDTIDKLCTYFRCQPNELLYVYDLEIDDVQILSCDKEPCLSESKKVFILEPPVYKGEIRFKSSSFSVNRVVFQLGTAMSNYQDFTSARLFLESEKDVIFPFLPNDLHLDFARKILQRFISNIKEKYDNSIESGKLEPNKFEYDLNFAEK
ncbi:helix-turn-helix transcriptional regulator [uncultured Acidaminococcus sp.]|uniref:helix-turn-helix domain-containing protein n=1 Tax=uncultured Acidaminococcus sp. TaxID=352152 RepID=UPI0026667FAB|nr:helix-turn-helix transcriptional regulator [uncultured Acidaminococcus sp.]